jgi:PAS domain S-box-containing protein
MKKARTRGIGRAERVWSQRVEARSPASLTSFPGLIASGSVGQDLSFKLLFEMANDAVFVVDETSGRIRSANGLAGEYTGRSSEALRGVSFADLFLPQGRSVLAVPEEEADEGIAEVWLKGTGPLPVPCRMTSCDATDAGVPVQVFVLRSLSERRRALEEISLKNEAMDSVGAGVVIADARHPDHSLIYVNRGFEQITGYTARESLGRNCRFLQGDDREQEGLVLLREALREGKACTVRLRNFRKDGSLFWNELHVSPVRDPAGDLTHFVGIQIDVTERVRDRERLKASEELKTRFIRMVSHEFRTPMTGIRASAAFLRDYAEALSPEKRARHFLNIEVGLDRMNRLLDDVLFASRSEAGKMPFEPRPVQLVDFCEHLLEEVRTIHGDRHIDFRDHVPKDSIFLLDTALLNQILHNLLSNALKYSPPTETVRFRVGAGDGRLTFVVEDKGIGIPDDDRAKLFEPFHRASNVGAVRGTGLGLYIAKRSAELHGGSLTVDSVVGRGSRFEVNLPANVPAVLP